MLDAIDDAVTAWSSADGRYYCSCHTPPRASTSRCKGTTLSGAPAADAPVEEQRAMAWVNYVVVGVIIACTALTVVSTQAMNTATRRREFALLRLTGSSRSRVLGMMRRESFTVVAVGGVLGTLLPVPPLALVAWASTRGPWPTVPVTGRLAIVGSTALPAG
ncbi:FtsX-like permease family protein [Streptomyces sp. 2A115]|uniref:FtsX-like permease family protein n=1 Tax=Streptomyces sp. 2A115 TaxID=3457439 RepID=UPI003FD53006